MKFQFASDLHQEFEHNEIFLKMKPLKPVADILLLAGDITYLKDDCLQSELFHRLSGDFDHVYLIPGNHEFYQGCFPINKVLPTFRLKVHDNVEYLNNQIVIHENVRLVFTSLWTEIVNIQMIKQGISDFHGCMYDETEWIRYQPKHHNECHRQSLEFLDKELSNNFAGSTIVISHSVPFDHSYCDYEHDRRLQEFFHADLSSRLKKWNVDYWIHGHNHFNKEAFQIENTWFHTNQLGYVKSGELIRSFRQDAIIEN